MFFGASTRLAVPYVLVSRVIIENKYFIGFTTLLTVYALLGDDIRTLAFDAPADIAFNCIVIFCITVFSLEIVLSVFGKDDYFLGFFFILDVVSTGTLILDLSWVSDSIASSQKNDSAANNARTSRAARLGAKMGRIVRVIRLVRILKLYKAPLDSDKCLRQGNSHCFVHVLPLRSQTVRKERRQGLRTQGGNGSETWRGTARRCLFFFLDGCWDRLCELVAKKHSQMWKTAEEMTFSY